MWMEQIGLVPENIEFRNLHLSVILDHILRLSYRRTTLPLGICLGVVPERGHELVGIQVRGPVSTRLVGHRRVAQCILGVATLVDLLVVDLRVGVRASVARVDEVQFRVHAGALQMAEDLVIRAEQGCSVAP